MRPSLERLPQVYLSKKSVGETRKIIGIVFVIIFLLLLLSDFISFMFFETGCLRSFSLPDFVSDVQEIIHPVLTAYHKVLELMILLYLLFAKHTTL